MRIFISSPGDVADEREKARQVIAQLQTWYGDAVYLVPVPWEELPLEIDSAFQKGIDVILGENPIDVAVFILWSRLGSPLGKAVTDPQGNPYRSGTQREFDLMLAALVTVEADAGVRRRANLAALRDCAVGPSARILGPG